MVDWVLNINHPFISLTRLPALTTTLRFPPVAPTLIATPGPTQSPHIHSCCTSPVTPHPLLLHPSSHPKSTPAAPSQSPHRHSCTSPVTPPPLLLHLRSHPTSIPAPPQSPRIHSCTSPVTTHQLLHVPSHPTSTTTPHQSSRRHSSGTMGVKNIEISLSVRGWAQLMITQSV